MSLITDEIFYNALKSSASIMEATNGRIFPTCIEVPPTEKDNTPLPYIIITFDGGRNDNQTKDDSYEGYSDTVTVGIEVSAKTRKAVGRLVQMIRKTVHDYMCSVDEQSDDFDLCPDSYDLSFSDVAWDWMKPCYYQTLTYQCSTANDSLT